ILVAGQTTAGAKVTVNGEAAGVDASGAFAKAIDAPHPGEVPVEVTTTSAQLVLRTVHFAVKRVDSLESEARAAEAANPLTYDAVKDDIGAHTGERIVLEGDIVDTRVAGHQTILVLTEKRGCAGKADPNQCLARILFGGEDKRRKGEAVRVFG